MITNENYEEYMMLLADGELSQSETEALKAFIKGNKELEQELAYYMAARIVPDNREIYIGKEELLKKATPARIIGLRKNWAYGIAAGIVLLIFLGIFKQQGGGSKSEIVKTGSSGENSKLKIKNSNETTVTKQDDQPTTIFSPKDSFSKIKKPIANPAHDLYKEEANNVTGSEAPKQDSFDRYIARADKSINKDAQPKRFGWRVDKVKKDSISHVAGAKGSHDYNNYNRGWRKEPVLFGQGTRNLEKQKQDTVNEIVSNIFEKINIDSLINSDNGGDRNLFIPDSSTVALKRSLNEEKQESNIEPRQKRNFLARLPIVGKKNVGINLVTDAVGDKVNKVRQIKNNLKNTDVVIKIGNKELLAFNL